MSKIVKVWLSVVLGTLGSSIVAGVICFFICFFVGPSKANSTRPSVYEIPVSNHSKYILDSAHMLCFYETSSPAAINVIRIDDEKCRLIITVWEER